MVGALAAVGLRLGGQDGRVKGKKMVLPQRVSVKELLQQTGFQRVCAYGQGELPEDAVVQINGNKVKAVYQNFQSTVLVVPQGEEYLLLTKDQLKCY